MRCSRHTTWLSISSFVRLSLLVSVPLFAFAVTPAASAASIDWVTVGSPGNACDPQDTNCFGSVATTYQISQFEITNAQYAEFLNAVAKTDPNNLYGNQNGITQTSTGSEFVYATEPGFASRPVNRVSYFDALRYANWLHNGQPVGPQGPATTDDGSYTITQEAINNVSVRIPRNPGATIVLPNEDEWYKAAYYDAASMSFFDFPAGFDAETSCSAPSGSPNTANCNRGTLSYDTFAEDVGSYPGSPSPFGTFDQGATSRNGSNRRASVTA